MIFRRNHWFIPRNIGDALRKRASSQQQDRNGFNTNPQLKAHWKSM